VGRAALAVWLVSVSATHVAAADEFPVPPPLAAAVQFWIDVFTRYSLDDVVVHDRVEPGLVYQVVRGADGKGDADVERRVQGVADRLVLQGALRAPWSLLLVPDALRAAVDPIGHARLRLQHGLREVFAQALVGQRVYRSIVEEALAREGLPAELSALPLIESSYRPEAESPAGAVGLWQLTRDTGRSYLRIDHGVDERRDPVRSSEAAARHLALLREALPSWPLALTAYNRGLEGVERARRAVGSDDLGVVVSRYRERGFGFAARNFYAEFLAALHVAAAAERYFPELAPVRMVEYRVKPGDTLTGVARRHGVSLTALRVDNGLRSEALQPGQRILIRL
jgi:membrane-bound lytic murein transglycosylase D